MIKICALKWTTTTFLVKQLMTSKKRLKTGLPAFLLFFLAFAPNTNAQLPWLEDFSGYPDQTIASPMWIAVGNDCDDTMLNDGDNWWGVVDATDEFRCNDIEGFNCMGTGGDNQSSVTTVIIDISTVECVEASIGYRANGDLECNFPAGPVDDPVGFYNSHDQMVFEYSLNGGPWTLFANNGYLCIDMNVNNLTGTATTGNLMGNTLQLRVTVGNQSNAEDHYITFMEVVATSMQPNLTALPPLCDNGNSLTLNTNQDGFTGQWSGPSVSANMFDPSIGAGTYTLTFTPNPGQCGDPNTTDVVVNASPTANPAGPLAACDNGTGQATFDLTTLDATIGGANPVLWFEDMGLNTMIGTPGAYTSGPTTVYAIATAGPCISGIQAVSLTVSPQLSTANVMTACSMDNSTYTVTFDISGGTMPYNVSGGGNLVGSTFTSDPIPSGTPYNFTITDSGGCPADNVSGTFECCSTSAGTMDLTPINLCTDQTATATHNGDQNLDGNDVFGFVLHAGTLNGFGDVIAFDLVSPSFNFNGATMTPGVTYFISAVAGNVDVPLVDFSDLCLDISPGTPVTWTAPPSLNSPGNQNVCNSYTLPVITGTNLSGNEAYFTGPNGTGTQFNAGQNINTTTTLFIFDESIPGCSDEESFTVTILSPPDILPLADQTACGSYTLPNINGSNLTGAEAYYTGANGTGTQFNAGQTINTSTTLFIYDGSAGCDDEESFTVTITPQPDINPIADQTACNSYTLPNITGTNLTGSESYYTGPNGTGTMIAAGTNILANTTLFIYDGTPGCDDQESFTITITPEPDINPITDQTACGSFTLPNITGSNLTGAEAYFTGPSGTGTQFNTGQTINTTTTLFIYDGTPGCDDEESFTVTITAEPNINPIADQISCGSFTLPNIIGTNLTGSEAYYTGPNGTGISFNAGQVVNTNITLFIYDGVPGCDDQESFTITIAQTPDINPIADALACGSFTLPNITGTNLTGAQAYYTGPNGTGAQLLPGAVVNTSISLFIYDGTPGCEDQETFNITVNAQPQLQQPADVFACNSFTLPIIQGLNLSGNEAYFSGPNGTGTQFTVGQTINTSTSLFIYDNNSGCEDEVSFSITITPGPDLSPVADETACGSFTLAAIQGTGLSGNEAYYTGTGGAGTQFNAGQTINTTTTLFIYDGMPGCEDEESFTITILPEPQLQAIADVNECGGFTLPNIQGTNLSGNEAYYTGPNGTGTQFNAGETITASTTLFVFDDNGTCSDEISFDITISSVPDIDDIEDQEVCEFYTLPNITGTDLSGNEAYFTESGGMGTQLNPGELIFASTTLFIYDESGGCSDEESFNITIFTPPVLVLTESMPISCNGDENGSLNLEIAGNDPFTVDWNIDELDGNLTPDNLGAGTYQVTVTDVNDCEAEANFIITEPDALDIACSELNPVSTVGGNDGEASVDLSGGTAPYDIEWTGPVNGTSTENMPGNFTISDLEAGNYQINVTDENGCMISCNFTITDPNCTMTVDISGEDITCFGDDDGSISLTIENGADPLDIDWNVDAIDGEDNPQNLEPGDYDVVVTDNNGCSAVASITINEPDAVFLNCSVISNTSGPGVDDGQVELNFGGGTGTLTIEWTGAITTTQMEPVGGTFTVGDLPAGDFFLSLMDENGCTITCDFTITSPDCITTIDLDGQNLSCSDSDDGSITLTINDGPADPTIDWNFDQYDGMDQLFDLVAGDYMVTVSDGLGCEVTGSIMITAPDAIMLDCAELNPVSMVGAGDGEATITFSGGTGPYSIEWFGPENGDLSADDPATTTISDLEPGSYQIFITDINECMTECNFVITDPNCTLSMDIMSQDISCRGEADGSINLNLSGGEAPITIDWNVDAIDGQENPQNLEEGIYDVVVTDNVGCEITASITLEATNELPEANITFGGMICADECYGFNISLSGEAPFTLNYQLEIGGNTQNLAFTTNENINILEFCPADLGVTSGAIGLTFISLEDANCIAQIDQSEVITVIESPTETLDQTLCDGESITVNGNVYDATTPQGMEVIPGTGPAGCDSVYIIDLSFFPPLESDLNESLCSGESITVNGVIYDESNPMGTEILTSTTGCDSTVNIELEFFDTAEVTLDPTLCTGESITVNGNVYDVNTPSGQEILSTVNGCDSTVNIALSFVDGVVNDIDQTLCEGGSITVNGTVYDETNPSGQEIIPNGALNGCDSIINVDLAFSTSVTEDIQLELCEGESLIVNGNTYDQNNPTGTETIPNGSVFGCDSIITVALSYYIAETTEIIGDFCIGESITVNGTVYDENNSSGTEVFTLPNGCDSTVIVDLNFVDEVTSTINSTLCEGESITVNGVIYDIDNPSGSETIPGGSVLGCDSTIIVDLSFDPTVSVSLSGGAQICAGESVTLTFNISEAGQYDIRYTDGLTGTLLNGIEDGHTIEVTPAATTQYFVDIVVIPGSNCPANIEGSALVEVSTLSLDLEVSDFGGFGISCNGSEDGSISAVAQGALPPLSYAWSTGATSATLSELPAGDYSVTITDAAGCTQEAMTTLTEPEAINFTTSIIEPTCFDELDGSIILESIQGGTVPLEYSLDGQFYQSIESIPFEIANLAGGNYTLHIQDANDCQNEVDIMVPTPPQLFVDLGDDVEIKLGDSIALDAIVNFNVDSIIWSPIDDLSDPLNLKTFADPLETTTYNIRVTDENGCTAEDAITVFVDGFLIVYAPNVFSPNDDGINDYFTLFGDSSVNQIEVLQIFDRWGNQVFTTTEIPVNEVTLGWDGKFKGKAMNPGVYVFYAEVSFVDGRRQTFKGDITLLK